MGKTYCWMREVAAEMFKTANGEAPTVVEVD